MMNMLNMGARNCGQLSGVTIISALTITALSFYYSQIYTQWPVILITGITAGAFLVFFHGTSILKNYAGYGGAT